MGIYETMEDLALDVPMAPKLMGAVVGTFIIESKGEVTMSFIQEAWCARKFSDFCGSNLCNSFVRLTERCFSPRPVEAHHEHFSFRRQGAVNILLPVTECNTNNPMFSRRGSLTVALSGSNGRHYRSF